MKKSSIGIIIAIVAIVVIGGLVIANKADTKNSTGSPVNTSGMNSMQKPKGAAATDSVVDLTNQTEVSMDIRDFKFEKPKIKIKKGTKVTWTNQDSVKHNVILDDTAKGAPSPDEVRPDIFAGPLLAKGESYSFTFNEVTANGYHCSPHPYMKGMINVVE